MLLGELPPEVALAVLLKPLLRVAAGSRNLARIAEVRAVPRLVGAGARKDVWVGLSVTERRARGRLATA